jgi:hypothetical protein
MPEATLPYLDEVALLTAPDRRDEERCECDLPASLEESPGGGPIGTVRVRDLSLAGMGLVGDRPFDQGQHLIVGLHGEAVVVEVVYRIPDEAGQWRMGCLFASPLTSSELRRLRG